MKMKLSRIEFDDEGDTASFVFDFFPRASSNEKVVRCLGRMMEQDRRMAPHLVSTECRRNRLVVRARVSLEAFRAFSSFVAGADPDELQMRLAFEGQS